MLFVQVWPFHQLVKKLKCQHVTRSVTFEFGNFLLEEKSE